MSLIRTSLLAVALLASPHGSGGRAEIWEPHGWCDRINAIVQSFLGTGQAVDWEVIEPPANIDRDMAMTPPASGTMKIIRPRQNGFRR